MACILPNLFFLNLIAELITLRFSSTFLMSSRMCAFMNTVSTANLSLHKFTMSPMQSPLIAFSVSISNAHNNISTLIVFFNSKFLIILDASVMV